MSKAEMYYRQVNCLTVDEHPILGRQANEVIELMEDFHKDQLEKEDVHYAWLKPNGSTTRMWDEEMHIRSNLSESDIKDAESQGWKLLKLS